MEQSLVKVVLHSPCNYDIFDRIVQTYRSSARIVIKEIDHKMYLFFNRLLSISFYEISYMVYGFTIFLKIGFPNTLIGYSKRREFTVFIIRFI